MSITPIFKEVDLALDALLRGDVDDPLARAEARGFIESFVTALEQASERAARFHQAGLVSEAFSVVKDFPDLTQQLHDWQQLLAKRGPKSDLVIKLYPASGSSIPQERIDELQQIGFDHADLDAELRSLRRASLEQESVQKLRARYESLSKRARGSQTWIEQLERVEREWIEFMRRGLESGISDEEIASFTTEWFKGGWVVRLDHELSAAIKARWDVVRQRLADERYASLVKLLHAAYAAGDREGIERVETDWAAVNHDTGRMPSEAVAAAADPAFQWAESERTRLATEARQQAARDELEQLLDAQASANDVLRAWTRMGDENVPIPEGLHERASRYLETHRVHEKRRFALKGLGVMTAALVLGAMVFWGWRTWERRNMLRDQLVALEASLDQRKSEGAVETAEALVAGIGEGDSRAVQLLERAKVLKLEHDSMASSTASLESEVDAAIGQADDAQAAQFKGRADTLLADKRLEGSDATKSRLEAIRSKCESRQAQLVSIAASKAADAEAALAAFTAKWPDPNSWRREEYVAPDRWMAYSKALEEQRAVFDAAVPGVSAHEAARRRIEVCAKDLAGRLDDARSKLDTLQRVTDALKPESLGKECTRESDFVNRITGLLAGDNGVFLEKLGLHDDFSTVVDREAMWAALQEWREALQGKLLGVCPDASKFGKDPACDGLPDELRKVIAASQRSPLLLRLKELEAELNGLAQAASQDPWNPVNEAAILEGQELTPLKIRALPDGRWLRYRPVGGSGYYLLQAEDLTRDRSKLLGPKDPSRPDNVERDIVGPTAVGGKAPAGGKPAPQFVDFAGSKPWEALIKQLKVAGTDQYITALADAAKALQKITRDPKAGGDPQLQARMLVAIIKLLLECGQPLQPEAEAALKEWLDQSVGDPQTRVLLSIDPDINWIEDSCNNRATVGTSTNVKPDPEAVKMAAAHAKATAQACEVVISRLPLSALERPKAVGAKSGVIRETYIPVGVLMHRDGSAADGRRLMPWKSVVEFWVVVGEGQSARLAQLSTTKGPDGLSCQSVPPGVPQGPVLVFERRIKK